MRLVVSDPIQLPMRLSTWGRVVLLAALALMTGCGKPQRQSSAGEVMGYFCSTCKAKFYVEQAVVADFCPQRKGAGIQPVISYVCTADGHLTLNIRHSKPIPCEQCGAQTSSVRQPTAVELEAYGAVKKSRNEVCRQ